MGRILTFGASESKGARCPHVPARIDRVNPKFELARNRGLEPRFSFARLLKLTKRGDKRRPIRADDVTVGMTGETVD